MFRFEFLTKDNNNNITYKVRPKAGNTAKKVNNNNLFKLDTPVPKYKSWDYDDFKDEDYDGIFKSNLFDKDVQTITKVYSDLRNTGVNNFGKVHQIYITLNYRKNCIDIINITRSITTEYKKHLKVIKIENECSRERVKHHLDKFNSIYNIDSSQWYNVNKLTNIYVKAEVEQYIQMFEITYDKGTSNLSFKTINTETNESTSGSMVATPEILVQKYNSLKSSYMVDHYPEELERPPINNNTNINRNNNNTNIKRNNNNNYRQVSDNNYDSNNRSNDDNKSEDSKKSVVLRDQYGREVGRVDKDGTIRDFVGFDMGRFDRDGTVRDRSGFTKAEIGDGFIKDRSGNKVIEFYGGIVRDDSGRKIGEYDNGVIKDENGNVLGETNGLSDGQAIYQYFYKGD